MKDLRVGDGSGFFETADHRAFLDGAGITFGGHDDADGRSRIPFRKTEFGQFAVGGGRQQQAEVRLQPHQHRLCFGVAEADVEFQHARALIGDHDAGIEAALERPLFDIHEVDRRNQHLLDELVHQRFGDDRRRAVSSHAAGVRSGVVVERALVVLRRFQRQDRVAVDDRQDTRLVAGQTFFNDNLGPRRAEGVFEHDPLDRAESLLTILADKHSLARREAVGLDDQRRFLAVLEVRDRVLMPAERVKLGRRHVRFAHQFLREDFASFEFGRSLRRAKDAQIRRLKGINHARHQ